MDFICVKAKPRYGAAYVNRLYDMVARHYMGDFTFYCLTDDEAGIDSSIICKPLKYELNGWWNKIQVFEFSAEHNAPLCFLDLDTVIVGNLNFLDDYSGDFAVLTDFCRLQGYQSCFMLFNNGFGSDVCQPFWDDPQKAVKQCEPGVGPTWGDQRWLELTVSSADILQRLWPDRFISFKVDVAQEMIIPFGASVLCFHGEPRPHHFSMSYLM